jgi:hypothetical protein
MPMTPPTAPAAPPTGQPPVGSSPATAPVPNKGLEAAGMAKLGLVVKQLETIVPLLGAGTEAGKDVLKALTSLSKHVPPGAVSPGVEQSALQNMMMKQRQQMPQIAAMRQAIAAQKPPGPAEEPPATPSEAA